MRNFYKKLIQFIKKFKLTITPDEYREQMEERYRKNPELWFSDNYECGL